MIYKNKKHGNKLYPKQIAKPRESCGIVAVFSKHKDAVRDIAMTALYFLQHRGQDSAGIVTYDGLSFHRCKSLGPILSLLKKEDYNYLEGYAAICHTRYSTVGSSSEPQPVEVKHPLRGIVLAHNGNLANYRILKEELESKGYGFDTDIDAEVILYTFVDQCYNTGNEIKAIENTMRKLDGAYSVALMTGKGRMFVFRDPHGIRPLVYGHKNGFFVAASEIVSLDMIGIPLKGDVLPGSIISIDKTGYNIIKLFDEPHCHCMFEWLYFARPDAIMEGTDTYEVRVNIGKALARTAPVAADYVIPVPDTSRPYGIGYHEESGIPYREGLIPNRYAGRTFIQPAQVIREKETGLKYNAAKSVIKGKRLIVIDDSIVRGTTSKRFVRLLKNVFDAKEVHLRIATPRIIAPCFYGIDMSTYDELASYNHTVEELCEAVGADSLAFLDINSLVKGIGINDLCVACLTDKYPTPVAQELAKELKDNGCKGKRPWE